MPVPVKKTMRKMYLFPILWIVIKKNIEIKKYFINHQERDYEISWIKSAYLFDN